MTDREIDIILRQLNNLEKNTIRMHEETCASMEKGFSQHAKLFSDWGAVVIDEKRKTETLLLWQEGHRHETTALADALNALAQTQQKTADDVDVVKKYQDNQKTIIAFVATLVSVVWVVVTFVLDILLK